MRNTITCSALLLLSACTLPTLYRADNGKGGYSDEQLDSKIAVARFAGNAHTDRKNAEVLSHLRGVEICLERGDFIARFWGTTDRSTNQTVEHTAYNSYASSSYFTGQNGSYSGIWGSSYGGQMFANAVSWNQVLEYPTFDTAFSCTKTAAGLGASFREYAKDSLEGAQVESIETGTANEKTLHVGDLILKIDDERIRTAAQIGIAIDASPKKDFSLSIVRDGQPTTIQVTAFDITPQARAINRTIVKLACDIPQAAHRPLCSYSHPVKP